MRNRLASLFKHRGQTRVTRWYARRVLARKLFAILLFRDRWGQAGPLIKAYVQGYRDGWHDRLGRNQDYLP